ncbi:hypothetical protein F511_35999 [Dorcoceras hygrometricum]|uniref:Uncharacterized protein n=1 Tax=Dorcoceras hygrometricum TaxID=472368 RepID=A0A2Z7AIE0_9LAMI|nr:hypothetical protein F511_35999 [Dorcoceras hygrometricum]
MRKTPELNPNFKTMQTTEICLTPLILFILSVDCIPTAECAPTNCSIAVRSAVVFSSSQHFAQQLVHLHCNSWEEVLATGCPDAGLKTRCRTPQNPPQVLNTLSSVSVRESRIQYLCDPQWFRDTASRGPTTFVLPESQFRTCPSDHDNIGYPRMSSSGESSTTIHRLLHASGPHPIPPPNDPKTNQYNQDLGLIRFTNGNHLESPNEGSSIDHQVTIYLHAQNITMFPTNETWYFASQILVSSSGGHPHFDGPID